GRRLRLRLTRPARGGSASAVWYERAMLRAGLLCCAVVLVSCAEPSRVDQPAGSGSAGSAEDPWAKPAGARQVKKQNGGGFDPTDLKGAFSKIAESVGKPGPYEAPDRSRGLDETKPHWGVLALSGDIVERGTLSWSGGHGTE